METNYKLMCSYDLSSFKEKKKKQIIHKLEWTV